MAGPDVARLVARSFPNLKRDLRMAHINKTPKQFVSYALRFSLYISLGFAALAFFIFSRQLGWKVVFVMAAAMAFGIFASLVFIVNTPKGLISRRKKEIDREVLFAGRYLLVKLESGAPLFNSFIDASRSFNVSAKYFKEIVHDINTGTPIENALDFAREYNASDKFKKILWHILAALKSGTEIADSLRATLRAIANEQLIEIKEYGKKLNSLMLFYMVMACVVPSLGVAMFIIIASFLDLQITKPHLFAGLFGLALVQVIFIIMIRASRPAVDL